MKIKIVFERSEAVEDATGWPCGATELVLDSPEGFVQLTYATLRDEDGTVIAVYDEVGDVWVYDSQPYSDIVVALA